jgi:hypothetical protein
VHATESFWNVRRAQTSNGAADTSTEATIDADDDEQTEEALEAKMQEFLRQQALQESGEQGYCALSLPPVLSCSGCTLHFLPMSRLRPGCNFSTGEAYVAPAATGSTVLGADTVTDEVWCPLETYCTGGRNS